ncbi:hypothetical protein ACWEH1_13280 [Micromonospora chersina]
MLVLFYFAIQHARDWLELLHVGLGCPLESAFDSWLRYDRVEAVQRPEPTLRIDVLLIRDDHLPLRSCRARALLGRLAIGDVPCRRWGCELANGDRRY